jgi:hypothetical protein
MPTVRYIGPKKAGFNAGPLGWFDYKVPREVSQEWMERFHSRLNSALYEVTGYSPSKPAPSKLEVVEETVDEGDDGIPDNGWLKNDIVEWLEARNVEIKAGTTKRVLLRQVEELNNEEQE